MENYKQKRSRATDDQMHVMLQFMEKHSLFARGQISKLGARGHEMYNKMWVQLSQDLNNCGPAVKDVKGWMSVWKNTRLAVKRKKAEYNIQRNRTGNIGITVQPLTTFENRVSVIFGNYGNGLPILPEVGVKNQAFYEKIDNSSMGILGKLENERDKRKRDRPSKEQLNVLVEFIESHLALVPGLLTNENTQLWTELTNTLNRISGGAVREVKAWITCWKDLRTRVEQKRILLLNTPDDENIAPLTDYNMKVLNVIQTFATLENSTLNSNSIVLKASTSQLPAEEDVNVDLVHLPCKSPLQRKKLCRPRHASTPLRETSILKEVDQNKSQINHRPSGFAYLLNLTDKKEAAPVIDLTKETNVLKNVKGGILKNEKTILSIITEQSKQLNDCIMILVDIFEKQNNIIENGIHKICETINNKYFTSGILKQEVKPLASVADEEILSFHQENNTIADITINKMEKEQKETEELEEMDILEEIEEQDEIEQQNKEREIRFEEF